MSDTTNDQLVALIDEVRALQTEPEWAEFKENNGDAEMIGQLVSGISNSARLHDRAAGYVIWGVNDQPEAWVVHASPAWSRANIDLTSEQAADALFSAFRDMIPEAPQPTWLQVHRWRYAFVETPAKSPFAWDPDLRLGLCGDWRIGARVEAAWLSGDGLGAAMRIALGPSAPG